MSRLCQQAAVTLAIMAMVLRGLLPAGWMPNPDGMSQTALIICDMDDPGMSRMAMSQMPMPGMDMPGMPASAKDADAPHKHADDGHPQPCPFAAAPHVATSSAVAAMPLPMLAAAIAHLAHHDKDRDALSHYAPQSPRAPPALA